MNEQHESKFEKFRNQLTTEEELGIKLEKINFKCEDWTRMKTRTSNTVDNTLRVIRGYERKILNQI